MCILNLCKELLGGIPKVVGMDIVEMAIWAKVGRDDSKFFLTSYFGRRFEMRLVSTSNVR